METFTILTLICIDKIKCNLTPSNSETLSCKARLAWRMSWREEESNDHSDEN